MVRIPSVLCVGLKESSASSDEKRKMMDILTRVEKETADDYGDDVDGEELLERLQDLDLDRDADKIWSRLTEKVIIFSI